MAGHVITKMAASSGYQKRRTKETDFTRKKGKRKPVVYYKNKKRSLKEDEEIATLQESCLEFDSTNVGIFSDFPLSRRTVRGLSEGGFMRPTDIQKESIGLALKTLDILGAAKTGSGKTLAFLVPVLECLYKQKWSLLDGLGALIITPTRELAYQIFEVLRKVGRYHDFSAGLIIGGKDLKFERTRLDRCNIIICTPGRLLHHMDENPLFDCSNLQVLVLDEADRILDLGFQKTVNAIIENLPPGRQTLLFSATQTKSVKDLARLSLKDPVYVSVHEHAKHSTPEHLQQSYIVCELHDKLDLLWSFVKHHLKQKVLVFMASCKQVKYTYEIFCRMRPGMSVLALYGSMHQMRRMNVYNEYCNKQSAVLFATDLAARGLDFPAVHWVVQMDCPEDANTYIHRVGRTARYEKDGEALLVLLPSEEDGMIAELKEKKIPLSKIKVNPNKQHTVQKKLEACLARDVALKDSGKRAFVAYLKSVFLMKNKAIFKMSELNTDAYARSLGMAVAPRIRFLQKAQKLQVSSMPARPDLLDTRCIRKSLDGSSSSDSEEPIAHVDDARKSYNFTVSDNSDDELFSVTRRLLPDDDVGIEDIKSTSNKSTKPVTKAAVAKKLLKKKIKPNTRTVFADDGEEVSEIVPRQQLSAAAKSLLEDSTEGGINIEIAKAVMREEDRIDKQFFSQRVKIMHKKQRLKEKEELRKQKNSSKKKKEEQEQEEDDIHEEEDYFTDSQSDSGSLNEIIDALPDPDKVYEKSRIRNDDKINEGEYEQSSDEVSQNSEDSSDTAKKQNTLRKRKLKADVIPVKKKRKSIPAMNVMDTGLSLADDEELALHLLTTS